jgi:hypothetical protein
VAHESLILPPLRAFPTPISRDSEHRDTESRGLAEYFSSFSHLIHKYHRYIQFPGRSQPSIPRIFWCGVRDTLYALRPPNQGTWLVFKGLIDFRRKFGSRWRLRLVSGRTYVPPPVNPSGKSGKCVISCQACQGQILMYKSHLQQNTPSRRRSNITSVRSVRNHSRGQHSCIHDSLPYIMLTIFFSGRADSVRTWICIRGRNVRLLFSGPMVTRPFNNVHTAFECGFPGCSKRFSVSSNAKRHLRTHGVGLSPSDEPAPLPYIVDFETPVVFASDSDDSPASLSPLSLRWMPLGADSRRSHRAQSHTEAPS